MTQFIVDSEFWDLFPEAQINVLTLKGIDNSVKQEQDEYFTQLLAQSAKEALNLLPDENFSQNEVIAQWRDAYSKFKTKKGARSSIEALLKRASQGREFSPINPLVDLYNATSLKFGVPCGAEDIDKIAGDMHLGQAKGGEDFFPLGAEESAPALEGEIFYYDNEGAICRCLNWREAQRTMLTEETKNAVVVFEAVYPQQVEATDKATQFLKELAQEHFGVQIQSHSLTKDNPEVTL